MPHINSKLKTRHTVRKYFRIYSPGMIQGRACQTARLGSRRLGGTEANPHPPRNNLPTPLKAQREPAAKIIKKNIPDTIQKNLQSPTISP